MRLGNCCAVAVAFLALSQPASAWAEEETPAAETLIIAGEEEGTVYFDATENRLVFPAPSVEREFDSVEAFAEFAKDNLYAQAYFDVDGVLIGVGGVYGMDGLPTAPDGTKETAEEVHDPVGVFLGGSTGTIWIAKQPYCVRPDVCGSAGISTLSTSATVVASAYASPLLCTGMTPEFCARGGSFLTKLPYYYNTGSWTERVLGGRVTTTRFCWKWGWVPWTCSTTSGPEHTITVVTTQKSGGGIAINGDVGSATNVQKVQRGAWFFGSYDPRVAVPVAANTAATCGTHWGDSNGYITGTGLSAEGMTWHCP